MKSEQSYQLIKCAYTVHSELGPGLLESTYESCLAYELKNSGFNVNCQVALPLEYKGLEIGKGYRVDMIINDQVILELKSIQEFKEVHFAQLLAYLKLSKLSLGYLINFNVKYLKHGIKRIVNNY